MTSSDSARVSVSETVGCGPSEVAAERAPDRSATAWQAGDGRNDAVDEDEDALLVREGLPVLDAPHGPRRAAAIVSQKRRGRTHPPILEPLPSPSSLAVRLPPRLATF